MTLQQIHYALEIVSCGSMNKAAGKLYISQPTLTSAIKEMENELDITLFHRYSKGVSLTPEGKEFLDQARQLYQQYELLMDQYGESKQVKQKFAVSTQHYSFAVKAFADTIRRYDTLNYEFAIRETKTHEVIEDVAFGKSEIGILYRSTFNRRMIDKLLYESRLEFHPLAECMAYVYLHKGHPLAKETQISFAQLADYPCLSFEQGDTGSAFLAEEILSDRVYDRTITVNDRATMLNLMIASDGYTLCSGIICEELNGGDYKAVPFHADEENPNDTMQIGYITKKGSRLNRIGEIYIGELKKYLQERTGAAAE